jgi:F-type H+-transporting ATPase subunit epsilon
MKNQAPSLYLDVEIASQSRAIYSGQCAHLIAPGELGEMCIMPRHTPVLTRLRPGEVRLRSAAGEDLFFYVSGGFMEVQASTLTILADDMLRSDEIDREAALKAKQEAEAVLEGSRLFSERDAAKLMLIRALAQLRVIEHELARRGNRIVPSSNPQH